MILPTQKEVGDAARAYSTTVKGKRFAKDQKVHIPFRDGLSIQAIAVPSGNSFDVILVPTALLDERGNHIADCAQLD